MRPSTSTPHFVSRQHRARAHCMRVMRAGVLFLSVSPGSALADHVVLKSGAVLEGQAVSHDDKVVVTLESGSVTLPRESVLSIDHDRAPALVVAEMRAHLRKDDVEGRLNAARFCRAHELPNTERELLLEVLALAPEQAEAHARLGHVRTKDGFVDGVALERQRREAREAEAHAARDSRERAALETEKARLERDRAALALREERLRNEARAQPATTTATSPAFYYPYANYARTAQAPYTQFAPAHNTTTPFDINGVRSPHDMSFSLPGVRDPRSYFGR